MLALSPLFHPFGLELGDQMSYEQDWACNDTLPDFNLDSFGCSSPMENEIHSSKLSGGTSSDPSSSKKLNHNASERERRKKLNDLYSTLRSLLPRTDLKKKLSIPSTISQALKYVPQLQSQVQRLVQRKEEILSSISKQSDHLGCYTNHAKFLKRKSLPTVSSSQINDREVVIQVCTSKCKKASFSEILQNLEGDGLQIINASAFASHENQVFYTLHVQVKETQRVECEMLSEKMISLC